MWRSTRLPLGLSRRILFRTQRSCIEPPTKNLSAKPFREIPGPSMLASIIKYSRQSMDNFHRDIVEGFEKYGPVYKFVLPGFKMVFIGDPKDTEHVFRNDNRLPSHGINSSFAKYFVLKGMKEGILGDDESWYSHRSTAAPNMLLPHQNKGYLPGLIQICDDSIARLKEGRNTNVMPMFQLWAAESIFYVMFGHRAGANSETPNKSSLEFTEAVIGALDTEGRLMIGFPLHKYIKTPLFKKFIKEADQMSKFTLDFMEKIANSPSSLPEGHECLFEKFKKEGKFSNDEISQAAVAILVGGVDTTSTMLMSTLLLLSKSQRAQAKLYEEINSVIPNGRRPTHDDLKKMPYLKATLNEVTRVYPVNPGIARQLSKPIELGGYEIPAGVTISMPFFKSTQMNKQIFGDDHDRFRPERWLRENKDFHPFASIPFSFGPRMCVGKRIAEQEIYLFLVRFLQKFKVEENNRPEDQFGWVFSVVVRPDKPFNLYLTAR